MKKRLRMALVLMLAVALCLTGCNPGGGGEKEGKDQAYQLTVCSMFTSADAMYEGLDYLCKLLEERTDGRIQCEFYGDKALTSSDEETADVISNGIADLSTIPSYTFANLDPTLNCFGMYEVPFLFLTEDEV